MQTLSQLLWLRCLKSIIDLSPLTVEPETSVSDVISLMSQGSISVLVMSVSQLVGWFTAQDVVRLLASGVDFKTTKISEVMQTSVITLKLSDFHNMATVLSLLRQHQLNLLPIVDEQGKPIGIVTPESICRVLKQPIEAITSECCQNGINISELKKVEVYLQKANQELEQRVSQGTIALQAINQQLLSEISDRQINEERFRKAIESTSDAIVIQDMKGASVYVNPAFVDLCRQAKIELLVSQQRLQYLLSSSPAVIYTAKTEGDFGATFVSENVSAILGYEPREMIADSSFWASHIHPEDMPNILAAIAKAFQEGLYKLEYRFLHQDGIYRWVYDQGQLVRDNTGKPLELVGYMADITDRKQLEQELIISLEKEKELSELKSRFVAMTSHEFRTPLSTILSSSELLEHYRHKWSEEKQLTHLHRIQTAVKRMTEMLNDILAIGKLEATKVDFRPKSFDLVAYCRYLIEETQLILNTKQAINFSSQYESISCCMDDKLLAHILGNLLSNAVKYSPDNIGIKFTISCKKGQVIFKIQDWGIGIPPEDIPHLFESFYRAKNVGNILGTGLGLAIVKRCVNVHKGEIFVTSKLGVGTLFTVVLPLNNQYIN